MCCKHLCSIIIGTQTLSQGTLIVQMFAVFICVYMLNLRVLQASVFYYYWNADFVPGDTDRADVLCFYLFISAKSVCAASICVLLLLERRPCPREH